MSLQQEYIVALLGTIFRDGIWVILQQYKVYCMYSNTHHQIPNDHDQHEHQDAEGLPGHFHAIPHSLDPLAAQHPKHNQKRVEEVLHVPAGQLAVDGDLTHAILVVLAKQLHAHHSENEDNDGQHQRQVSQRAY